MISNKCISQSILAFPILGFLLIGSNVYSQNYDPGVVSTSSDYEFKILDSELPEGYYLVAGVFSTRENVERYNRELKIKGVEASYGFSKIKNKYYSFLAHSENLQNVKNKYSEVKKSHEFTDTWILNIHDQQEMKVENESNESSKEVAIVVADGVENENTHDAHKHHHANHHKHHHGHGHGHHRDITVTHNIYKVFVNVHNGSYKEVPAAIKIVNGEEGKIIGSIQSHQEAVINCPKSESQTVQLVCEVFGFHKTTFDIRLDDPVTPSTMFNVRLNGDKINIDLPLERYRKGDIMVMYNVFFHANTNIMRMKSNYELQKLLAMLDENPKLKIRIHGHTNGNSFGAITKITDNCDNFFNPSETEGINGGSQKLSELRSEAIKMYLIQNNIDGERIDIKGWGGKKMIYKEDSPQYEYNVRVEVEVLDL